MNKEENALKNELLKIQIETERLELEELKNRNRKRRVLFFSFKEKGLVKVGQWIVFFIVAFPILIFYYSEFFLPVKKYENFKLMKDVETSYLEIQKTKSLLAERMTHLEKLREASFTFSEFIKEYNKTTLNVNLIIGIVENLKNEINQEDYFIVRNIYGNVLNNSGFDDIENLIHYDSVLKFVDGQDYPHEIQTISTFVRIEQMFQDLKKSITLLEEHKFHVSTSIEDRLTFTYDVLRSADFDDFRRKLNGFSVEMYEVVIFNSIGFEKMLEDFNKRMDDDLIIDKDKEF